MYNNYKETKKFNNWKKQEEEKLRKEGVQERNIKELRSFDKKQFSDNRKFMEHEIPLSNLLDFSEQTRSDKSIDTIDRLLDEIEDETIFLFLKRTDKKTLKILLLRINGYSSKEISSILNISESAIRQRISRLRKKFKNICEYPSESPS